VEVVYWLLEWGAGVHERTDNGMTPLLWASRFGRTGVVRLLLERGADPAMVNGYGYTPLMEAALYGRTETVACLLAHPRAAATIDIMNHYHQTALWLASLDGRAGPVRVLSARGADPTIAGPKG
jgi:uncharacterized protein